MTKVDRPEWAKNSPHGYGLLSMEDVQFLERTIDLATMGASGLRMVEIGVQSGLTMAGIWNYVEKKGGSFEWVGVDLPGYGPSSVPPNSRFIGEPSEDAWRHLEGMEFDLIFIDGCHCSNHTILDFANFSPFLRFGGLCLFHDTNGSEDWVGLGHPGGYQGHGPEHPAWGIGVRAGLKKLGLLPPVQRKDWEFLGEQKVGNVQGMMLFRKVAL